METQLLLPTVVRLRRRQKRFLPTVVFRTTINVRSSTSLLSFYSTINLLLLLPLLLMLTLSTTTTALPLDPTTAVLDNETVNYNTVQPHHDSSSNSSSGSSGSSSSIEDEALSYMKQPSLLRGGGNVPHHHNDNYVDIDDVNDLDRYRFDYDVLDVQNHRKLVTTTTGSTGRHSSSSSSSSSSLPVVPRGLQKDITNTTWIVLTENSQTTTHVSSMLIATKVKQQFNLVFNGLIVQGVTKYTLTWLLQRPDVLLIEEDQPVHSLQSTGLPGLPVPVGAPTRPPNTTVTLKDGQPWGIDIVDGTIDKKYSYTYSGDGVKVFVFDSGIMSNHDEFSATAGRVTCGLNLIEEEVCDDLRGHGTHIAATIGGKTYGLARKVSLINIKVLDNTGNGRVGAVLVGLEYVAFRKLLLPTTPMIINMSLGSNFSATFNDAVDRCVDLGVIVVIASGNEEVDACTTSPSSSEKGIVVGGVDVSVVRANWSNYGDCVDIHAPAIDILSANYDARDRKKASYRSGTSMAAPHVAGVIAMYLEWDPTLTPIAINEYLSRDSTSGVVKNLDGDGNDNNNADDKNNLLINSVKVQTYYPNSKAPTISPTKAPTMEPTSSPAFPDVTASCGRLLIPCTSDADCCYGCLALNLFDLGIWGQRCFIFG